MRKISAILLRLALFLLLLPALPGMAQDMRRPAPPERPEVWFAPLHSVKLRPKRRAGFHEPLQQSSGLVKRAVAHRRDEILLRFRRPGERRPAVNRRSVPQRAQHQNCRRNLGLAPRREWLRIAAERRQY